MSRQVASLDRAGGTPLLERHHNGVRTTPAGQGRGSQGRRGQGRRAGSRPARP
ncbi:LysR family transcriptional regulator [Actinopolymorpha pittospori]|uniref:LysR family transcriptional regulator n=1 Tax=Actinopolymorpha pittospori TaxID=648752 RepID=UPI001789AC67